MASNAIATDTNAKLLDAQARGAVENAAFDERQGRRHAALEMGSSIATAAASGIDITRGSPLFLNLDAAKQTEIQAQSIRRAGKIAYDNSKFQSRLAKSKMGFDIAGQALSLFGKEGPGGSILSILAGTPKG